jgi:large subunit ribosomal protein L11
MSKKPTVQILVDGGKAAPGPPLGPALGPLGLNINQVVSAINEKTKDFAGMKVPVKLIVDPKTKQFEIEVGTPPTSALIKKELGIEKGSATPGKAVAGDIDLEKVRKVAKMKGKDMLAYDEKKAMREVLGTCVTLGLTVEGKDPRVVQKEL